METNYSQYLHRTEDGTIWWPLETAVKLGAGYLPLQDNVHNLNAVLSPPNNRVIANGRTLLSTFNKIAAGTFTPPLIERDGMRIVNAKAFIAWQNKCSIDSNLIPAFPTSLAKMVGNMEQYLSMSVMLANWYEKPFALLPDTIAQYVQSNFLIEWDALHPDQRRSVAEQYDSQHDPANTDENKYWWDFFVRLDELKQEISKWESVAAPTAIQLEKKEIKLSKLRSELDIMNQKLRISRGDYSSHYTEPEISPPIGSQFYIDYIEAFKVLTKRLNTCNEEIAAWIWMGPKLGGLTAYRNANELQSPPRFYYEYSINDDYLSPLMYCWFVADDIANFSPTERYITGKALLDRWSKQPGILPDAYIHAKITESRLEDMHPIMGFTQWTGGASSPPKETALFMLSRVMEIEADAGIEPFIPKPENQKETKDQRRQRLETRVKQEKSKGTRGFLRVVAREEGFSVSRLKQILDEEIKPKNTKNSGGLLAGLNLSKSKASSKKTKL